MSLVSNDDPYTPRVVPKVFADVPSQAEVTDLRRSRSTMAVWFFVVLGMLIAAIAALVFVTAIAKPAPAGPSEAQVAAERQLADARKELDRANAHLSELAQFDNINTAQKDIASYRASIAKWMEDSARANARTRIPRRAWAAYDTPLPDWKPGVELSLTQHRDSLQALDAALENLAPPTGGGGGSSVQTATTPGQ